MTSLTYIISPRSIFAEKYIDAMQEFLENVKQKVMS
jgi:hypothetical protein